jgi:hypothetical protein
MVDKNFNRAVHVRAFLLFYRGRNDHTPVFARLSGLPPIDVCPSIDTVFVCLATTIFSTMRADGQ